MPFSYIEMLTEIPERNLRHFYLLLFNTPWLMFLRVIFWFFGFDTEEFALSQGDILYLPDFRFEVLPEHWIICLHLFNDLDRIFKHHFLGVVPDTCMRLACNPLVKLVVRFVHRLRIFAFVSVGVIFVDLRLVNQL